MIDAVRWDLPRLDAYLEATLRRMAGNRDVCSDATGEPYYTVLAAGRRQDGTLRLDFEADLSAIGMPTNAPLTLCVDQHTGPMVWSLGDTLITTTPRSAMPEEAGDALNMDVLLDAHRRWVGRGSGFERGR